MASKKGITQTQQIIAVVIIIVAVAAVVWYVTRPPPEPPEVMATLTGKITDEITGLPIDGAAISVNGEQTNTGSDGTYSLEVVAGTYTVTSSKTGYDTNSESIDASEEKTYSLDLSMMFSKYGGTLTISLNIDPTPSLDPIFYMTGPDGDTVHYAVFETLVIYDFDMTFKPYLAESYTLIDDVTYEFKIRQGVKFHDGIPLNASAVKFHIDRIRDVSSPRQASMGAVKSVNVIDDYTVRITLEHPSPDFLHELSTSTGVVSPTAVQKWGEDFGLHPVGTGPFKFIEWISGDHITLEAFEEHWAGRPYIDEIILNIVPEPTVRIMQIEAGEAQLSFLDIGDVRSAEGQPNIQIFIGDPAGQEMITLNQHENETLGHPALQNVKVRQAINYAINRKAIIDSLYYGYGEVGIGPLWKGMAQFNPDLQMYPDEGDPAKARELLVEAGYEGLKIGILGTPGEAESVAVILKEQLAEAGIELDVDTNEFGVFAERLLVSKDFDISNHGWSGSGPTPLGAMGQYFDSRERGAWHWNMGSVNDPEIDSLLDELREELDPDRIQELCDEIQQITIEKAYFVCLLYPNRVHIANKNLQGYQIHPHPWYGLIVNNNILGINLWLEES
jgi:peptide/nickel transport system substrate-binding protein